MAKTQTPPAPRQTNVQTTKKTAKPVQRPQPVEHVFLFDRENYLIMAAGVALLIIGYLLMVGGKQSPNNWDPNVVYSFRIVTLSTIVVLAGFLVILISIFRKKKNTQQ